MSHIKITYPLKTSNGYVRVTIFVWDKSVITLTERSFSHNVNISVYHKTESRPFDPCWRRSIWIYSNANISKGCDALFTSRYKPTTSGAENEQSVKTFDCENEADIVICITYTCDYFIIWDAVCTLFLF